MKKGPGNLSILENQEERERFHELFVAYREAVFKMAYAILRNREEAMDIVQDTFVKAMEKSKHLKATFSVKGWLLKVARNLSIDRYRRRKSVPLDEMEVFHPSSSGRNEQSNVMNMDLKDIIREIFPELPPREQEVFALRYYEDMTFREISDSLGVAEGTVKTLHHRVMTRIRALASGKWGKQ